MYMNGLLTSVANFDKIYARQGGETRFTNYFIVIPQWGNFRIFLSVRFYVKPILEILGVLKMPFLPFWIV